MTLPLAENWFHNATGIWSAWMRQSFVSGLTALALAALLTWLLRRRGSMGFLCVVWLLVLARVAVPVNIVLPFPLPAGFPPAAGITAEPAPAASLENGGFSVRPRAKAGTGTGTAKSESAPAMGDERVPQPEFEKNGISLGLRGVSWQTALFGLWLTGAAAGLFWLSVQARLARRLVRESWPASPGDCPVDLTRAAAEAGLRRVPQVRTSDALTGPAVTGLWSPVLLLPRGLAETLTPGQFRWAVAHELSHLRRGDLWVQWFESMMKCLFFFHPAVWIASRQLSARREECCDHAATALTGLPARESAAGLLTLLERALPAPAAALGMNGDHRMARQRMRRLLAGDGPGKRALFPWTAAAIVPAVAVLSLGAVRPAGSHGTPEARRIQELESRVAELEGQLSGKTRRQTLRENAEAAARSRAALDAGRYSPEELHEMELIYQEAKKQPDFASMISAMQPLFDRFPASNRAGCAALYLGRRLEKEERARLLNWAADSAGDCLFLDGTSVGGLARILLARDAVAAGRPQEAAVRLREARAGYADGIDFEGTAIADLVDEAARELP